MIGIWPKRTGLIGATGRDQATSIIALYGPRTTVLVALDDGVYEFTYGATVSETAEAAVPGFGVNDVDVEMKERRPWICTKTRIEIKHDSKLFSPANLRSAQDLPGYAKLIDYYMTNRYTLRCK